MKRFLLLAAAGTLLASALGCECFDRLFRRGTICEPGMPMCAPAGPCEPCGPCAAPGAVAPGPAVYAPAPVVGP